MKASRFICQVIFGFLALNFVTTSANAQIITTIAGTGIGGYNSDGIPAVSANLNRPTGLVVDSMGNVYVSDNWNKRIRLINSSGIISTIAGTGVGTSYSGEGGPATAANFVALGGLHKANAGTLLLCNTSSVGNRVNEIDAAGIITTIIGTGIAGYSGDGGPATAAECSPGHVCMDRYGSIYISDVCRIRKIDHSGIINTISGSAAAGDSGDGGPATAALLGAVGDLAVDRAGNIYFALGNNRVRKINTAGIISTIAGNGTVGYSGDGLPATDAQLFSPVGMAIDGLGNIYVADRGNHAVRKIDAVTGIINTITGSGVAGYSGDGGLAVAAQVNNPLCIKLHPNGDIFFVDNASHRVRKISYGNHIPIISGGTAQSLTLCEGATIPLNTYLAVADMDAGQTLTWTLITPPAHGTAAVAHIAASTGGTVTPAGLTYTQAPGYSGADTFEVRVDDGRSVDIITFYVTVSPLPVAGPVTGSNTVCIGHTTTLTGASGGGTWFSPHATVSVSTTGVVSGLALGTAVISYMVSNSCGTVTATFPIDVISSDGCPTLNVGNALPAQTIGILPNPNSGTFSLQLPSHTESHITITDITGRKVKELRGRDATDVQLNVSAGVYFIKVTNVNGTWEGKVLVSN